MTTFTIDKITGEFEISSTRVRPGSHGSLTLGAVKWDDDIVINGVTYPHGYAEILYRKYWDGREWTHLDIQLFAGLYGRSDMTDAAKDRLTKGILGATEVQDLLKIPTVEELNERVLEDARHRGTRYASHWDSTYGDLGADEVAKDWASAYEAIGRGSSRSMYSLPDGDDVVTQREIAREFLNAAHAELTKTLEKYA